MRLIPGVCTQCGATLSVEKDKDAMICPYCNTPFVVEKAIQNFNNTYVYNVTNNITAKKVIIQGDINKDFDVIGGVLSGYTGSSTEVIIPYDVIAIGDRVFERTKIEAVAMSDNVTEIRDRAFWGCSNLKTVTLSQNIKWIGNYAFSGCTSLENMVLPNGLTSVGFKCFEGAVRLKLYLPDSIEGLENVCNDFDSIYLSSTLLGKFEKVDIQAKNIYIDSRKLIVNDLKYNQLLRRKLGHSKIGQELQTIEAEWKNMNRCQYCGGSFRGFFTQTCSQCGRIKDY